MENNIEVPQKIKNRTTIQSSNPTSACLSREKENTNSKRCMHPRVHCSTIHNSQDTKELVSIDEQMGENVAAVVIYLLSRVWRKSYGVIAVVANLCPTLLQSHELYILAWRIPGTGEPGGLLSMGSHRVRHDWSDLAAAAADLYIALQSPLSMGFSGENTGVGYHFLLSNLHLLHWEADSLPLSHQGSPKMWYIHTIEYC